MLHDVRDFNLVTTKRKAAVTVIPTDTDCMQGMLQSTQTA